jgi:hypothetical protein
VVTQQEYDAWLLSQKPKYQTAVLDNIKSSAPAADSAKQASIVTPANTVVKK